MTKNNYKPVCVQRTGRRLGDYIKKVNVRNTENLELPLMGLSIQKCFIPSIANTIGTNMKTYKIIEREQFAYGPVTSRNGDKITIALFDDYDKALISQAYIPFEIKDKEKLLPKYLMMWFSRPEFDRYARFKSHGSARETFDWEEMCDVKLPIPSIEKQREIVADYQAVENKIKTNEAICEKLEETAQTIYRRWFEEFEFPDKEGKPYKSNGGVMVWNEELLKEVPEGWEAVKLSDLLKIKYGKNYKHLNKGKIPLYGSGGLMSRVDSFLYDKPSILIPRKGTLDNIMFIDHPFWSVDTMFYTKLKKDNQKFYIYYALKQLDFNSMDQGSAVPSMTTKFLKDLNVLLPKEEIISEFDKQKERNFGFIKALKNQNETLHQLQALLLGRMTREEKKKLKY